MVEKRKEEEAKISRAYFKQKKELASHLFDKNPIIVTTCGAASD